MSTTAILAFALVALLGVVTPGLDTMVVLRHALLGGRKVGIAVVLGISLGCLVWGAASTLGLTALLVASETAYRVVQLLGAAYLIWLGASGLWRSLRRGRGGALDVEVRVAGAGRGFRAGLVTNLLNPKVGVFYMSLLPQFLPVGGHIGWGALLVAMHIAIGLAWLGALVVLAGRARRVLSRVSVKRWLDRATAGVLLGLGAAMVADAR
ncbi:LysE family translocator [Pseudonocardia cypriaca]|uniref:Threonine/homoserine/homoserine lactone efflux protein n=1 Tax=Pseudonocardia cypriaca TaxID=882449 RepID=A0A543FTY3_9PSEU|nr:LysE family translocator [Pseudonocardia cypriaca]TQM37263.1 threonine/homoserine/homoserine lactone efflux protein [Pseudonocardia cypriaca]